uniref:Tail tube protein n=1 Tax=Siphoviridae sp. ctNEy24 TaxID=2825466 RepID=A0A8S5U0G9_9CAUD|nr:MAG TPA: tail tube protein [Siphoviridae sp. ctNEy24]
MATISKGIKLSYKEASGSDYTELTNLQEIPDLGGEAEAIEITVLSDAAHMYTDGILNYGDSLAFKFLYDKTQFTTLNGLSGSISWKVELPDGATCSFTGTSSVKLDSVGVNAALTYELSIKPNSAMAWA